jgi:eukaryotic-like serine/threonine-protein kinase
VPLPTSTDVLASRYRLDSRIAGGGMGEVWRAIDMVLGRPVAVKLLRPEYAQHPETLARFRAEARHAAALSHPAIAQVYDYGDTGDGHPPFLVMELVDGPPLTRVLADGPLDPAVVLDIVAQVAAGLAAAHAAGVLHRDIKPGNLLVGAGGAVKITDFGISYAAGSAPLTRTGTVIGTPGYLAPERLAGAGAGPSGDVYSLGMVAYQCLSGGLPFTGTAVEIALAHQHQPLPPLPMSVPTDVAVLVDSMTAKDPAMRPSGAAEVAARAAALRDSIANMAETRPEPWPAAPARAADDPAGGAPGYVPLLSASPSGQADTAYLSSPGEPGLHAGVATRPPSRSRWLLAVALGVAFAAILGLGGWVLATSQNSGTHGVSGGPRASASGSTLVDVRAATFVGQPAEVAVHTLRSRGFQVSVVKQPDPHHEPGVVLSVRPSGRVSPGTVITIFVASRPGNGHDHGHGDGNNQGGD